MKAKEHDVVWSCAHTFFANMGGFVIEFHNDLDGPHASASEYGGFTNVHNSKPYLKPISSNRARVTSNNDQDKVSKKPSGSISRDPSVYPSIIHDIEKAKNGSFNYLDNADDCIYEDLIPYRGRLSRHRPWRFEAYVEQNSRIENRIGKLHWALDPLNASLVRSALNTLRFKDLTPCARRRMCAAPDSWFNNLSRLQGTVWTLNAEQLLYALEKGLMDKVPSLSVDQLDDRNKSDWLVKVLAVGQLGWLLVQVIVRGAYGHPPSQLEIFTLAFAVCTLVMYVLLWFKPQDMRTPLYIKACRRFNAKECVELASKGPIELCVSDFHQGISNSSIHSPFIVLALGSGVGSLIFGGVHCAAWNLSFPTTTERLLWRVASVATAVLPLIGVGNGTILHSLIAKMSMRWTTKYDACLAWSQHTLGLLYVLARLYITVEIFLSLRFLDPGVYSTRWVDNLPHI
ncbi:hypothetical protein ACLMJK_009289 [Lecanora helva]